MKAESLKRVLARLDEDVNIASTTAFNPSTLLLNALDDIRRASAELKEILDVDLNSPRPAEFRPDILEKRRAQLGLNFGELSRRIVRTGIRCADNQAIHWLRGINTPSARALAHICEALGMSVGEAYAREPAPGKEPPGPTPEA